MTNQYYNTPANVSNPMNAAQGYGQPAQQGQNNQAPMLTPGQIPGFSNMVEGSRIPVGEFIGQYAGWALMETQYGQAIAINFVNVQVMESDAPWPYAEVKLQIRYSNNLRSGYGIFGESLAKALGIAREACDLEMPKGHFMHVVREDDHVYGQNQQTGQEMTGTVWHVYQVISPGSPAPAPVRGALFPKKQVVGAVAVQATQAVMGQGVAPVAPAVVAPVAPAIVAPAATPAVVGVAPVAPAVMPVEPPPAAQVIVAPAVVVPAATMTTEALALSLLNGKDRDTWTREVMNSQQIREDAALFNAILNNQWLANMMGSGRVVQNQDGTYTVNG